MDKIHNKLAMWKSRLLSQAERSILLKSVIQAQPAYTMQTYLLPIGVSDKID